MSITFRAATSQELPVLILVGGGTALPPRCNSRQTARGDLVLEQGGSLALSLPLHFQVKHGHPPLVSLAG